MNSVTAKVTLVEHTPQPERLIASAARLCYASDTDNLLAGQDEADVRKFVAMLRRMGHMSPFEHASFTFLVEGVSRAMTHQLVRHRLASYSQRSQRYVGHKDFDYVVPPQLAGKTVLDDAGGAIDAAEYFRQTMEWIAARYQALSAAMGDNGESSNEDARYVLPNACETKIYVTMNARELLHFFSERLCMRAQWEIRSVAQQMLGQLKELCPAVFSYAAPKCVEHGRCPEGRKSCGQFSLIKSLYGAD